MTTNRYYALVMVMGIFVTWCSCNAQEQDGIKILSFAPWEFPKYTLKFVVYCDGQRTEEYEEIRVYDDNRIQSLTMICPETDIKTDVGFLIDRSGSHTTGKLESTKQAILAFLNQHYRGYAFVASFSEKATLNQSETSILQDIVTAVERLEAGGNTALWDGMMLGIQSCTAKIREFIVITDAEKNTGGSSATEVLTTAKNKNVRIHALCLGGRTSHKDSLKMICTQTGGAYQYIPNGVASESALRAIGLVMQGSSMALLCDFVSVVDSCEDGMEHELILEVKACGKVYRDTLRYLRPLNLTLPKIQLSLPVKSVYYGQQTEIPIFVSNVGESVKAYGLELSVYIPEFLSFEGIAWNGYGLIKDLTDVTYTNHVLTLSTNKVSLSYNMAGLCGIIVRLKDSVATGISSGMTFLSHQMNFLGCMGHTVSDGWVTGISKGIPYIFCETSDLTLHWDKEAGIYNPDTVALTVQIGNPTPIPLYNPYITVHVPPELELLDGPETRMVSPNPLEPVSYNTFHFRALPIYTRKEVKVCFEVGGDSTEVYECCTSVVIEPAAPSLEVWCEMDDSVTWSEEQAGYIPQEVPLSVYVRNSGKIDARNIALRVTLPPACLLASTNASTVMLTPDPLLPGDTAVYTWNVRPQARAEADYMEFPITVTALDSVYTTACGIHVPAASVRAYMQCDKTKTLYFNDTTKQYNPSFTVATTSVTNTSQLMMYDVMGTIMLPSFLHLTTDILPWKYLGSNPLKPGATGTFMWILRADGLPEGDSTICIAITAPNYSGDTCCVPVRIRSTLRPMPQLVCSLTGPDTVRYVNGAYIPNPITMDVRVENLGDTTSGNVYVVLHQGADISIDSLDVSFKKLTDSLQINASAETQFRLDILDRTMGRYDTIRISAYSDNGGAVVCEKIVWIEEVRAPVLRLQCSGPDSLTFDDATLSYIPSPFQVYLTATNVGTDMADSIVAKYLASPNMELIEGESAAKMLAPSQLDVQESGNASWIVNAVPRSVSKVDTLFFDVHTKSALLEEVIPCPLPIYVPAVRKPELEIECYALDTVTADIGAYTPDPVTFCLRIRNPGTAVAFDVTAVASPASRLQFATGQEYQQTVATLDALTGETIFLWKFHASPSTFGDTVDVGFFVSGRFCKNLYCNARLYLPPIPELEGRIAVQCSAPDTIRGNMETRTYPNPVLLQSAVTNTGTAEIDTVVATLLLPDGMSLSSAETGTRIIPYLQVNETRYQEWKVDVLADTSTVLKDRLLEFDYITPRQKVVCESKMVVCPFLNEERWWMSMQCSSPDTIWYDKQTRTFDPAHCTVQGMIRNTGNDTLHHVSVAIAYPSQVTLVAGEPVRYTAADVLLPGDSVDISWLFDLVMRRTGSNVDFHLTASSDERASSECTTTTYVQGYTPQLVFQVQSGNVVGFGRNVHVPVVLNNDDGISLANISNTIGYDSSAVTLIGLSNNGTLAQYWNCMFEMSDTSGIAVVHYSGESPVTKSGILYHLIFAGTANTDNPFDVLFSDITIHGDSSIEGAEAVYVGGDIVTTGNCIVPLEAAGGFILEQNIPNPFNPITVISYQVPALAENVRTWLTVFDTYGRVVSRFDEGLRNEGRYSVKFNASGLESGVYFYKLEAGQFTAIRKMIVMK